MKISVLITTRNRAEILKECLKSLEEQSRSPNEVIVVDNNSSDHTKTVVNNFKSLKTKYLFEKKIGISYGRNRGLKAAKGDIFAFIDDDCMAEKNWIKEIEDAFNKNDYVVGVVGRNNNMFPKNPYATAEQCWLLYWYLKHISTLSKKEALRNGELINFKNMAFRKLFFQQTRFNIRLPMGKCSEEDTEIRGRLFRKLKLKEKIIYHSKVIINHRNRTTFLQLVSRRFYKGISFAEYRNRNPANQENHFQFKGNQLLFKWRKLVFLELSRLNNFYDKLLCVFCIPLLPISTKIGIVYYLIINI